MESRRVHLFMTMVSACECSVDRTKLCMQWNIVGIDTWAFAEGKRFAFSKNQKHPKTKSSGTRMALL